MPECTHCDGSGWTREQLGEPVFSPDIERFRLWWDARPDSPDEHPCTAALAAWQEATKSLPCGHPAACDTGSGCGWCAGVLLAAEVSAAEAVSKCAAGPWQDIKDAPKDGTEVLLIKQTTDTSPIFSVGSWNSADGEWQDDGEFGFTWTHFARLQEVRT